MFSKRLKGASIAEMIIVIAVLSIISTIVVSFIVMSNENIRASNQKVDALNDIAVVESIVESWVKDMRKQGGVISFEGETLEAKIGDTPSLTLSFIDGVIKRNDIELYTTSVVKSISYDIKNRESYDGLSLTIIDQIVLCTITYEIQISNNNKHEYEYSFAVYSYEYLEEDDNLLQGGNTNEENN